MDTMTNLKGETGRDARRRIRAGGHRLPTSGIAPGYVQGNLAILPRDLAADFLRFCHLNARACPVIGVSEPGDPAIPALGADIDIRLDLPAYRVWKDGELVEEQIPMRRLGTPDEVADVIHFLCEKGASYVSGAEIQINGGQHV